MIEFVLAIICFGIVGILLIDLPWWRAGLSIILTIAGATLIRFSGVV